MAAERFPILKMLPVLQRLITMRWDNLMTIKNVKVPLMFVGGDRDTFVPVEMTNLLYEQHFGKKRELLIIK